MSKTGSPELRYPDGVDDHEGIIAYAERVNQLARAYQLEVERAAFRNILYYLGIQWITYDPVLRMWRPLALRKSTPRPVTNRIAPLANSIISSLVAFKPPVTYGPGSDAPEDVAAAMVADRINTVIERETLLRKHKPLIARWLALTGNVFIVANYDTSDESGTVFIQSEQCPECGVISKPLDIENAGNMCPGCGNMLPPEVAQPAMNPETGEPAGETYPRGRHSVEIENVFTARYDPEAPTIQDSPYFEISRTRSKEWVARMYGEVFADTVNIGRYGDQYAFYHEALAYTTAGAGRLFGSYSQYTEPRVQVQRLWIKPHKDKAPGGIYAVICGGKVAEARDYPYHNERGEPMLNVAHLGFDQVPGRLLYKTRIDDLIPKQEQRNYIESMIQLHARRMANAVWLLPDGVGISRLSGEQGHIIRYNAAAGVPEPKRVSGDVVSPYLIEWLQLIDREMDDIISLYEVSRGEVPKGVSAYAALQLLDERAQQGMSNLLANWAVGFMELSRINLNIWREYADEERSLSLGVGSWAIQKFNKAQLQGGVDLDVELGQNRPTTQVGRRAIVDQAVRLALVNPMDPQERFRLLELLGLPELMEDYKLDLQKANRENDAFKNMQPGVTPPVEAPAPWDNHPIHLNEHRRLALAEDFALLDPMVQQEFQAHMQLHFLPMQQQAAMSARGPGQVAPGPAGGSKGTAKGDQAGTDKEIVEQDAQMASPDTDVGGAAAGVSGAM